MHSQARRIPSIATGRNGLSKSVEFGCEIRRTGGTGAGGNGGKRRRGTAARATSQPWGVDPQCRSLPRSVCGPRGFRWGVRMGRRERSSGFRPKAPRMRPCSAAGEPVRRASRIGAVWAMARPRGAVPYFSHALGAQILTKRLASWVIRGSPTVAGHTAVVPSAAGLHRRIARTVGRPGPAGEG